MESIGPSKSNAGPSKSNAITNFINQFRQYRTSSKQIKDFDEKIGKIQDKTYEKSVNIKDSEDRVNELDKMWKNTKKYEDDLYVKSVKSSSPDDKKYYKEKSLEKPWPKTQKHEG